MSKTECRRDKKGWTYWFSIISLGMVIMQFLWGYLAAEGYVPFLRQLNVVFLILTVLCALIGIRYLWGRLALTVVIVGCIAARFFYLDYILS